MKTMYRWIEKGECIFVDVRQAIAKIKELDAENKLIDENGDLFFFESFEMWVVNNYDALSILDEMRNGLTYEEIMEELEDEYYAMCEYDIEEGYYKEYVVFENDYMEDND